MPRGHCLLLLGSLWALFSVPVTGFLPLSSSDGHVHLRLSDYLTSALSVPPARFLDVVSQLNSAKYKLITFCLLVFIDLYNSVFFFFLFFSCLIFATEILGVKGRREIGTGLKRMRYSGLNSVTVTPVQKRRKKKTHIEQLRNFNTASFCINNVWVILF